MPKDQIEGPDQDGNYWYRGWRLEKVSCSESQKLLNWPHGCEVCGGMKSMWIAYPKVEMGTQDFERLWLSKPTRITITAKYRSSESPVLGRHVLGDYLLGTPTIEGCIDSVEAEIERQFQANLAAALKGD